MSRAMGAMMRKRGVAAAACVLALAVPSHAQLLDLGAPEAPPAGSGAAAMALAAEMRERAGAPGTGEPAAKALAGLAAELIEAGEREGPAGSARIVLGRAIAARLEDVAAPQDPAIIAALGEDLGRARAGARSAPVDEVARRLRDALAVAVEESVEAPGAWGWIEPPAPPASDPPVRTDLAGAAGTLGWGDETISAVRRIDAMLETGEDWIVYRRSARRVRDALHGALAGLVEPRAWLDSPAPSPTAQLAARLRGAVEGLARGDAAAVAALEDAARLIGAAALVERAEGPAARDVRAALAELILNPPEAPEDERRRLDALDRLLSAALSDLPRADERLLVRQLRPAWRSRAPVARQTAQRLLDVVPLVLRSERAMAEPALLSAAAAHQRVLDDLALIRGVSDILADERPGREPTVAPGMERVADRLLRHGQEMARPDRREAGRLALVRFCEQLEAVARLPGERELREAMNEPARLAEWDALTGGRAALLGEAIDKTRAAWLGAWAAGNDEPARSHFAALENLRRLTGVIDLAIAASDPAAMDALRAWPGWEMSDAAMGHLRRGLPERCTTAAELAIEGGAGERARAAGVLDELRGAYAPVLLAGRLARAGMDRGLGVAGGPRSSRALLELAAGAPGPRAWAGDVRAEVADVCRYAEELARAADGELAARTAAFVRARAVRALEVLEP